MPIFKTTKNILKVPNEDELFDPNWMDSDKLVLPPKRDWDYKRELTLEDVDIWEQLYYMSGGLGLYVSWSPYAEFYLITYYQFLTKQDTFETFYGPDAGDRAYARGIELGMQLHKNKIWVEPEDMWLYPSQVAKANTLILP